MLFNLIHVEVLILLGLVCAESIKGSCSSGQLRLGGSVGLSSGLAEICDDNGNWHGVCGWSFGCKEAQVACRQAGFSAAVSERSTFAFPRRHTPYGLYECTGSESSLLNCPPDSFWTGRFPSCDIWRVNVECASSISTNERCSVENSLRLVNGPSDAEGQLQICKNNVWNDVCGSSSAVYRARLAHTVCTQLGYNVPQWPEASPFISALSKGHYANNTSSDYVKSAYITCYNRYSHVSQCSLETECVECKGTQVSVKCDKTITNCVNGTVRLMGGDTFYRGYVEVCNDGIWGKILNDVEGKNTPDILCSALGFSNQSSRVASRYNSFDHSHNPVLAKSISCCREDSQLENCVIEYTEPTIQEPGDNYLGIFCVEGCTNGQIRIGEEGGSEGLVEICYGNVWTVVGAYNWDDIDAGLACKSIGYSYGKAVSSSNYEKPRRLIKYTNFRCTGTETSLRYCLKFYFFSLQSAVAEELAAVKCKKK